MGVDLRFHKNTLMPTITTKTPATTPPVMSGAVTLFQSNVVTPSCSDCVAVTAAVGITVRMALVISEVFT